MRYLFLLFISISFLFAHKVNLFISNKDKNIEIYSYFANADPCKNCRVIIKDKNKNILIDDKLNDKGEYSYTASKKNIEIIVDASSGHIVKEKINLAEVKNKIEEPYSKGIDYFNLFLGFVLIVLFFSLLRKVIK